MLTLAALALLVIIAVGTPLLGDVLNDFSLFSYPFGYYMASQGALIALVILQVWSARRQNALDEAQRVAED